MIDKLVNHHLLHVISALINTDVSARGQGSFMWEVYAEGNHVFKLVTTKPSHRQRNCLTQGLNLGRKNEK